MLGILAQEMPGTVYFSYNRTVQYYFFIYFISLKFLVLPTATKLRNFMSIQSKLIAL